MAGSATAYDLPFMYGPWEPVEGDGLTERRGRASLERLAEVLADQTALAQKIGAIELARKPAPAEQPVRRPTGFTSELARAVLRAGSADRIDLAAQPNQSPPTAEEMARAFSARYGRS